jgi:hypothetical protein
MSKATYLVLRGNIFYARIPLSKNDQLVFNRREVWRSLAVSHYKDALDSLQTTSESRFSRLSCDKKTDKR